MLSLMSTEQGDMEVVSYDTEICIDNMTNSVCTSKTRTASTGYHREVSVDLKY